MTERRHLILTGFVVAAFFAFTGSLCAQFQVSPTTVSLDSPESTQQLLVSGQTIDLTRQAVYEVSPAEIAAVDASGLARPLAEGRAEIVVRVDAAVVRVPLEVSGLKNPAP